MSGIGARIPLCMFCGKPGVALGVISGRQITLCNNCALSLDKLLEPMIRLLKVSPAIPARPRGRPRVITKEKFTPEEFKRSLEEVVEKKGRILVIPFAEKRHVSREEARLVAQELVAEKGWRLEGSGRGLRLLKEGAEAPGKNGS